MTELYVWGWGQLKPAVNQVEPLLLDLPEVKGIAPAKLMTYVWTTKGEVYCINSDQIQLQVNEVVQVSSCFNETWLLQRDGKVRRTAEGRLDELALTVPIQRLACGSEHTLALTMSGTLFSWGAGDRGKLGQGSLDSAPTPGLVLGLEGWTVMRIACGYSHNLVLAQSSQLETAVFSWGSGADGRLGHGDNQDSLIAKQVPGITDPCEVSCGYLHSAVLNEYGLLFTFGFNGYGQLGLGSAESVCAPSLCESLRGQKVKLVSCGAFHTVLCCEDGALYSMGLGSKGQLGNGRQTNQRIPSFVQCRILSRVTRSSVELICGPDSSYLLTPLQVVQGAPISSDSSVESTQESSMLFEVPPPHLNISTESYRPGNLPQKDPTEAAVHKRLVEEHTRSYLEKLKQKEREKRLDQERKLTRETEIRENMKIWVNEILPNWDNKAKHWKTMRLWRRGLPPRVRGEVWTRAVGNPFAMTPELYAINLKKAHSLCRAMESGTGEAVGKESSVRLVTLDISRTFHTMGYFCEGSPLHQQLRDLLDAFAMCRPDIGYVQGMSYIAGLLLLNLEPYRAFILLASIVSSPSLLPFFLMDEVGISKRCQAFKVLLRLNNSALSDHFEQEGIQPKMFLIEWFITLFGKPLTQDCASRVWDLYFLDGFVVLFRTAVALCQLLNDTLINEDIAGVMQVMATLTFRITDPDQLTSAIYAVEVPDWLIREIQLMLAESM